MIPAMIVPVLIRHDLLDRMIQSINYPVRDLVIIDNGPQFGYEPTWNNWVHKVHHIKMPYNLGVASSWNLGIKSMPYSDYWLFTGFDNEWGGESLQMFHEESSPERLVLSGGAPSWTAFSLGWKVVDKVGLFDEALHPAYFEDNDYEWRCAYENIEIVQSHIPVAHDNSSTLKAGFQSRNDVSYHSNLRYFQEKQALNAAQEGSWSIRRRRANGWD
jgi:hypothetical protein